MQVLEKVGLITKDAAPVPLVGVRATGTIVGRAARMKVAQRFANREDRPIEAVYKFPLPEGGAVCGFTVATGDRVIRGQVEERDKAFALYDDALARGDGAYLLDEERPNIFTLSVGNVNPQSTVDVEIEYVTLLEANDTDVRFFLPTTISPRYVPVGMPDRDGIPVDALVNPEFRLDIPYGLELHLDILGREEIAGLECPSHSIRNEYSDQAIAVEFSSNTVAMDRDFVLTIRYRNSFGIKGFNFSDGTYTYVQVDFAPQFDSVGEHSRPGTSWATTEVLFLLDCSGSMAGSSIEQAKKALGLFLRGMEAGTRFNVYRFGSTYEKLFPDSIIYDSANLDIALELLARVDANLGGTELLAPLRDIYNKQPPEGFARSIVLLTDGEIGNEDDVLKLARSDRRTRLFTVGIGYGPNEYLIRRAAVLSGGASEMAAPGERIEPKVLRLFRKVGARGVRDLRLACPAPVEQAPTNQVAYEGECVSTFARMPLEAGLPSVVGLSGIINGVDMKWQVSLTSVDGSGIPLPFLWARSKVSDLEEGNVQASGSRQVERKDQDIKSSIVAISRQYGLLSRETSLVAVEARVQAEKTKGETVLRRVPVMLTKGWGGHESRAGLVASAISRRHMRGMPNMEPNVCYSLSPEADMADQSLSDASESFATLAQKAVDPLADILALQTAEGGFLIKNARQAESIGLSLPELNDAADRMKVVGKAGRAKLVHTAAIMALLEMKFGDRRDEWYAVTEKSRKWLEDQVRRVKPTISNVQLQEWTQSLVR